MKKIFAIGLVIVLLAIIFSGCTENNQQNENTVATDTDGDGYPDSIDDFPNDSNLHEKTIWHQFENKELKHNTFYSPEGPSWQISSDVKYVEWTWNLVNLSSSDAKIQFKIDRTANYYLFVLYDITTSADSNRIVVDYSNTGTWTCTWYYTTEQDYGNLYLSATVYIVE